MSEPVARPRLLIVESDESVRRVLVRALAGRFEITPVAIGASALGRVKEERFDALLVEAALHDMSAVELLRQVRRVDEQLPVIVTSAAPDADGESAARELGAIAVVSKPYHHADLRGPLDRAIELALTRRVKR